MSRIKHDSRNGYNHAEAKLHRTLDGARLYDQLMPAIRAAALAGGGADAILKKSEVLAAMKIIEMMDSVKPDVALKAAIEITNRASGKPVERSISVYGDLNKMNERDLDNQIKRLIERTGSTKLVDTVLAPALPKAKKIKQTAKPQTIDAVFEEKPKV